MTICGSNTPMRYALQFSKPGQSYRADRFRNCLATETDAAATFNGRFRSQTREIIFWVAAPDKTPALLHLRYLLIDRGTGYRSNWLYISQLIWVT